ncbi:MAG: hypothetical protein ABR522_03695 [Marinobacter sp.]
MMRSESERQYYLGQAGIRLWYAREPLPGAAPSPEFRFPADDSAPEPESDPIVPRPSPPSKPRPGGDGIGRDRIAGIQALMAGSNEEAIKAPAPASSAELPASATENVSPVDALSASEAVAEPDSQVRVEAHLGFWVSERLVLVSSVSDEASERLQDALAENILASLGESVLEEARHVRWPVFGNPRVPGNSVDDLQSLLRSLSKELGSRKLLLLGVLADEMPSGRSEWLAAALGTSLLDFPRNLAELAAAPAYKRELWQQLKSAVGA